MSRKTKNEVTVFTVREKRPLKRQVLLEMEYDPETPLHLQAPEFFFHHNADLHEDSQGFLDKVKSVIDYVKEQKP